MHSNLEFELAARFGTFRPSDRRFILNHLNDTDKQAKVFAALSRYLEGWERSDWIESYSIERIGKWFAIYCPHQITAEVEKFAVSRGAKFGPRRQDAVSALMLGIKKNMPAAHEAA